MSVPRITLVLCAAVTLAAARASSAARPSTPIVMDRPLSGTWVTPKSEDALKMHDAPSAQAPLMKSPFQKGQSYRVDRVRVIVSKPAVIDVLKKVRLDAQGMDGRIQQMVLKKGERFESSGGLAPDVAEGSQCIARIRGEMVIPVCLWLPGFDKAFNVGLYRVVRPAGEAEIWLRIVDKQGQVAGWRPRD